MQQLAKELEVVMPVSFFFEEANNAYYISVQNSSVLLLLNIL
jgi:hypothetical protein